MVYDVIVVGGSYAGLSAGLQLARARRSVLVIDAGKRRNRFAATSHGFLGQDGRAPDDIAADARAQLMEYPTVEWVQGSVVSARKHQERFEFATFNQEVFSASRVILATGVIDELPAMDGLEARWGKSVFHCPYCHGYELAQGRIGVLASSPLSMHHALMLPDWGSTTFFTNGEFVPDAEQQAQLARRRVVVEPERVVGIRGDRADVELADGRVVPIDGLFTLTRTRMASPVAEQLGCEWLQGPTGPYIQVSETCQTSVAGVFACGDAARASGSVALAVGQGVMAGVAAHQSLVFA